MSANGDQGEKIGMNNESGLEHVRCNLCGADSPVIVYPSRRIGSAAVKAGEFRSSGDEPLEDQLVSCGACGLQYVTPRISASVVLDGYASAVDEAFVSQSRAREATFRRCLGKVQQVWKKAPRTILDVGAANGSFLKIAREAGWAVSGCEPSRWMCEWSKRNYGIALTQGTVFDAAWEDETFDVVTLWDVLEHTPDPAATLRECVRVLRPGGLLVLTYPDVGSWIARVMGRRWVFLLSVHYYYYTRMTIGQMLEQERLQTVVMRPHFQSLELGYVLFRAAAYVGPLGKVVQSLVGRGRLSEVQVPYWMGQTQVIARKKGS